MAPSISQSNLNLVLSKLRIIEAGVAMQEAQLMNTKLEMASLRRMLEPASSSSVAAISSVAALRPIPVTASHEPESSPATSPPPAADVQPTIAALKVTAPPSSHRICKRPGCGKSVSSSDPTHDPFLKAKLKRGEWSPRVTCADCRCNDKLAVAAAKIKSVRTVKPRVSSTSAALAQPAPAPQQTSSTEPSDDTFDCGGSVDKIITFGSDRNILRTPTFHGRHTNKIVKANKAVPFTESLLVDYNLPDGTPKFIMFFLLADGRGWVHSGDDSKFPFKSRPLAASVNSAKVLPAPAPMSLCPPRIHTPSFLFQCDACGEGDSSGFCSPCHTFSFPRTFCSACGDFGGHGDDECSSCQSPMYYPDLTLFQPNRLNFAAPAWFLRYNHDGPGVGIRRTPTYPGERTGEAVSPGEVVAISDFDEGTHLDADGKSHYIYFYRLADGRGWVHGFDPLHPGQEQFNLVPSR